MRLHLSPNGLSKSIVKPGSSARVVYTYEKQDFTLKRDAMMCSSPTRELRAKQILLSQRMGQDSQHLQSERTEVLALYEKGLPHSIYVPCAQANVRISCICPPVGLSNYSLKDIRSRVSLPPKPAFSSAKKTFQDTKARKCVPSAGSAKEGQRPPGSLSTRQLTLLTSFQHVGVPMLHYFLTM